MVNTDWMLKKRNLEQQEEEEVVHHEEEWVEVEEQASAVVDVVEYEVVEGLVQGQTEAAWGVEGECRALDDEHL